MSFYIYDGFLSSVLYAKTLKAGTEPAYGNVLALQNVIVDIGRHRYTVPAFY